MVVPIKFVFYVNNLKSSFINTKYNISISAHTESVTGLRLNSQGFNLVILLNLQVWQKHKVFAKTFIFIPVEITWALQRYDTENKCILLNPAKFTKAVMITLINGC